MQEEEKTVDIDTSGPDTEVELPETKEEVNETTNDNTESTDTSEKPSEQLDVQDNKENEGQKDTEQKKELDDYSDGVKRRIAKLTKKMREAERREEAATLYAKGVLDEQEKLKARLAKVDTNYVSELEGRIKSGMKQQLLNLQKLEMKTTSKMKLQLKLK